MTIHSRSEELIAAAIDFELSTREHTEVDDHLATCFRYVGPSSPG